MIGYSSGEITGAYVDRCLTQEDALLLSYYQGRSFVEADALDGAMASVGLSWDEAVRRCPPNVYPAGRNAVDNVTVAGKSTAVNRFMEQLKSEGIRVIPIHSHGIAPHQGHANGKLLLSLHAYFECILKGAKVPRSDRWVSCSVPELKWETDDANSCVPYYVNNLKQPVLFYDAVGHIPQNAVVLLIGLPSLLMPSIVQSVEGSSVLPITSNVGHLQGPSFFHSLGKLYTLGVNMDISCMSRNVASAPASSKCPDLGQLVTWDHAHSWSTYVIPYPKVNKRKFEAQIM